MAGLALLKQLTTGATVVLIERDGTRIEGIFKRLIDSQAVELTTGSVYSLSDLQDVQLLVAEAVPPR